LFSEEEGQDTGFDATGDRALFARRKGGGFTYGLTGAEFMDQTLLWVYPMMEATWLDWGELDDETEWMCCRVLEAESDGYLEVKPRYQEFYDTGAEENAWSTLGLFLASTVFVGHPRREAWKEKALELMLSSYSTEADSRSDKVVDGKPLKERVKGANIHSDYTAENHGIIHADYTGCIRLVWSNLLTALLLESRFRSQSSTTVRRSTISSDGFQEIANDGTYYFRMATTGTTMRPRVQCGCISIYAYLFGMRRRCRRAKGALTRWKRCRTGSRPASFSPP